MRMNPYTFSNKSYICCAIPAGLWALRQRQHRSPNRVSRKGTSMLQTAYQTVSDGNLVGFSVNPTFGAHRRNLCSRNGLTSNSDAII